MTDGQRSGRAEIEVRALGEPDLPAATRIMQQAFGAFLGAADPARFMADRNFVRSRWRADPSAALAALVDGDVVGSNFATRWGSVGCFGPLTVAPDCWDRGVASRLLEPTLDLFAAWDVTHAGLFTFPHSPKHVGLYQKFGFWPRYLTAVMTKPVPEAPGPADARLYSRIAPANRPAVRDACRRLSAMLYDGLDLEREVTAAEAQSLGDTVLLGDPGRPDGFAVCHCGAGTEAGAGRCYVKFGAARPGPGAAERFERLVAACLRLAASRRLAHLDAGVSLARVEAYRALRAAGFRTVIQGVCMHRPHEPGYHRAGLYVIDDWR